LKALILMLQFFTRLPLPFDLKAETGDFTKGIVWFTSVGLVVGGLLAAIYWVLSPWVGVLTLSVILVFSEALLTGGLHLDGLADTFDGLYSNRDKARVLEIMKDSRIGSNGALALMAWLLLKISFLNELLGGSAFAEADAVYLLLLMPVASKAALALSCYLGPYARKEGMGHLFIGKISKWQLAVVLGLSGLYHAVMPASLLVLGLVLLATLGYTRHVRRRIDGLTGDTLGAWHELSQLVYLAGWFVVRLLFHT
jgi:adenosylcobinamide-GDP ribazoletransferase